MFKKIIGTKDILPEEVEYWQNIEEISRTIFSLYNYKEIRLPLIEEFGLFNRSLGESSEIVQKQMFLIKKEKHIYTLRPEATASIARAYIENHLDKTEGFIKLYYIGPMFRAERPQKGRFRQFHHLGAEAIGSPDAFCDVEIISLADKLLKSFFIEGYKIEINSLGCVKDKKKLTEALHQALSDKINKLCADCRIRYKGNKSLRILDCKKEGCQNVVKKLNIQDKYLCPECKTHFNQVKTGLDTLNLNYQISPYLVRGLDYYTRTVFEIIHSRLGAQDALGAGGRYDNLLPDLGGPDIGAVGFAFGIERLLLVAPRNPLPATQKLVYIITLGEEAKIKGLKLLNNLREAGIRTDTDYAGKSLKGALRRADDLGAKYVLIMGEDELKKNVVTLKDMTSGIQKEIGSEDVINALKC